MHTWLKKRLSGVTDLVRVRGEYLEASRGLDETSISTLLIRVASAAVTLMVST